jgi:release factor glutamine methyltransferase
LTISDYIKQNATDILPLLCFVLDKDTAYLYTHSNTPLTDSQTKILNQLIVKCQEGIPFAYLVGFKDFYHLRFKVNQHTLIPREETETLIDISLDLIKKNSKKILDLGTGSGVIAITLKSKKPNCKVTALDCSIDALKIAKQNAIDNKCSINFKLSDWFDKVNNETFDLIISNPPYIQKNDQHLKALYDPINALVADDNGLKDIKTLIKNAPQYLNKNGYLLLEHGYNQQVQVIKLFEKDFTNIQGFKDIGNNDRCVLGRLKI